MAEEPIVVEPDKTQKDPALDAKPEDKDATLVIAEKDSLITKLTKERDDFSKGMNLWRERAKANREAGIPMNEAEIEELAEKKAQEAILNSDLARLNREKDDLVTKTLKENAELRNALKNRPGPSAAQGGSGDKPDVKPEFFTKEQLDDLKARGIDPNKVIDNLKKEKQKYS